MYAQNCTEAIEASLPKIFSNSMIPIQDKLKEERLIKSLKSFRSVPKKKRNRNFDVLPHF